MSDKHEVSWMESEGGTAHPDGDSTRQNAEIERLNTILRNSSGGGVTVMGREERAVHAVLAMAMVLQGALDDLMADCRECPKTLDRLLGRMENIIGTIRGTVVAPVEENVLLLTIDCEDVLAEMQRARGADTGLKDKLRDWLKGERLRKMAESMGSSPSDESGPAN